VITLGSPVTFDRGGSQSPPLVKALYRLIAHPMGTTAHLTHSRAKYLRQPKTLPVPISCIYSLTDGVVPRRRRRSTAIRHCTRTSACRAATSGWASTPLVLWIVADRLAQPEGQWRPFAPPPGLLGGFTG